MDIHDRTKPESYVFRHEMSEHSALCGRMFKSLLFYLLIINVARLISSLVVPSGTDNPNIRFSAIAWTLIYVLLIYVSYRVSFLLTHRNRLYYNLALVLNLIFIIGWTYFFYRQQYRTSLFMLLGIIVTLIYMITLIYTETHLYAYLLIPYVLWCLYLIYINYREYSRNSLDMV